MPLRATPSLTLTGHTLRRHLTLTLASGIERIARCHGVTIFEKVLVADNSASRSQWAPRTGTAQPPIFTSQRNASLVQAFTSPQRFFRKMRFSSPRFDLIRLAAAFSPEAIARQHHSGHFSCYRDAGARHAVGRAHGKHAFHHLLTVTTCSMAIHAGARRATPHQAFTSRRRSWAIFTTPAAGRHTPHSAHAYCRYAIFRPRRHR